MNNRLYSLTDVLKKTLYFFEALPVQEIAPYVRRKMLRDLPIQEVEDKVALCLQQHSCFLSNKQHHWQISTEGFRANDPFYHILIKRQQPLSLWELRRVENKKSKKKMFFEETNLISDGRFVQLNTGMWGLTEWELDTAEYPIKYLLLKLFRAHPTGLGLAEIIEGVAAWRPIAPHVVEGVLRRFPFFEQQEDTWFYSAAAQTAYDTVMRRFLTLLREQKQLHRTEREVWQQKLQTMKSLLEEVATAQQQTAAALAVSARYREDCDHLSNRLSEKELLLTLRKRELVYYRQQIKKLENKAQSILHQCRLWVERTRKTENRFVYADALNDNLTSVIAEIQEQLTQARENERRNRVTFTETRENSGTQIAALQRELIDLKIKMEQNATRAMDSERRLMAENNRSADELQQTIHTGQELERDYRYLQQEYHRLREENKRLECRLHHPLIRLIHFISSFFTR